MDQQRDQRSYSSKISALMDVFQQHTHDEEHEGLARLRKMLPQEELRELGKRYGDAIARAPKRSVQSSHALFECAHHDRLAVTGLVCKEAQ